MYEGLNGLKVLSVLIQRCWAAKDCFCPWGVGKAVFLNVLIGD